jgi:predicted membrane-bound mannosyltransferase
MMPSGRTVIVIQTLFCIVHTIDLFTLAYLDAFGRRFLHQYWFWETIADTVMLFTIISTFFTAQVKNEQTSNLSGSLEKWENNLKVIAIGYL